ncbi:hypothetical protein FRB91_004571 [Serendipita sp. 411]|nr:hypothetical protein FRC19_005075 [Serendipita sp. 401]KAG8841900.1 hypothetical protein FRB91_004571 [Serendipita sp. 411]
MLPYISTIVFILERDTEASSVVIRGAKNVFPQARIELCTGDGFVEDIQWANGLKKA